MKRRGLCLACTQALKHLQELGLEVQALVTVQFFRDREAAEEDIRHC